MQPKYMAAQPELDFLNAYCAFDLLLAEELEKCDTKLVQAANAAFQIFKDQPSTLLAGSLQLTLLRSAIDDISHYLWTLNKGKVPANLAPEIIKNNWDIYQLAKESMWKIQKIENEFFRISNGTHIKGLFEGNFFNRLKEENIIQNTKTIHAWVKHLLQLNAQNTTD
ncbi:hypothetical protein NO1_2020 [Candidatus Termititenax aidoneus]|uniref:Uncharacterized protein n=1 Tax=Termititenax aidoneus TaxID=2218524 RepID=A0A388TEH9_TERA1|nr:hypothetical protein NO1_2020 [Candidatus Termititenax aidoneus]